MSIKERLQDLEQATPPAVTRFLPPGQPAKRRVFLTAQARKEFEDLNSAVNLLGCRGRNYAALTKWAAGGRVHGNTKRGLFVDSLDPPPPDIWEVRVTEPLVQTRFIGCFAEPNTLVLMRLHTRRYLGDKGSQAWIEAMNGCAADWSKLFPTHTPFSASTIDQYVTENCDDFPV